VDDVIRCERCGRKLRSSPTMEFGLGKVCYEKNRLELVKAEYERNQQILEFEVDGIQRGKGTCLESAI